MEKTIITSGSTIDLAIEAALNQLGLDRDSVSVQVLQQAKPGFLGFGKTPAKVQVTYEAPDPAPKAEAPKSALGAASRSKPKASGVPVKNPDPKPVEAPKPVAPKQEKPAAPKAEKPAAPKAEKPAEKPERKPRPERKVEAPKEPKVYAPAEPGSVEEKIEQFLTGLLEHMGSKAVPHAAKGEDNTYHVELTGEDLGYLIGRRGDTLDAIQHLCNYSVNRDVEGHIRINVDAEDYRRKREDSLRKYARKKAQQVLKARRRTTLEPMNAYERHVI
ncbi:MAG: Jag N-terminal domain-containing protein, partial [Oscillospiraceae bacterium]|nr:Jag N-terminal domain-containing protein [Oscillospiraceae bacterium]